MWKNSNMKLSKGIVVQLAFLVIVILGIIIKPIEEKSIDLNLFHGDTENGFSVVENQLIFTEQEEVVANHAIMDLGKLHSGAYEIIIKYDSNTDGLESIRNLCSSFY